MEERPGTRRPYARQSWPPARTPKTPEPAGEDPLPPSARWYGTPADPHPRRLPRWVVRSFTIAGSLAVGLSLIAGAVVVVLRAVSPEPAVQVVSDALAGVRLRLPEGWAQRPVAPVTAFTSAAADAAGGAMVMAMPGPPLGGGSPREAALKASELYGRLLLHGDTVSVAEDAAIAVGGATGHARAVVAQYKDVVNRPAYLRVIVVDRGPRTLLLVAIAQPDDARARAAIGHVIKGATVG
ncbi:hypothetical protein C1I98_07470 [Spongiactinospora gelatinilytica]|uniref:Uncharacterized protein n=1 Tax=Spongiactinospora gelatinilytica TaxID=2666298 RepID=A0A2W2HQT5_9ACTN|nr:hypothetical protein [Spongiactinospora gelatinilytica]PZG52148.1 hypothetical protein C1I98_07470 [Spongiactinospora gelatinilytica]